MWQDLEVGGCRRGLAAPAVWVLACVVVQNALCQTVATERAALIDLYTNTSGPSWTSKSGWVSYATTDPCSSGWQGVFCSNSAPYSITYVRRAGGWQMSH